MQDYAQKLIWLMLSASVIGAYGAYMDVQKLKAEMKNVRPVVNENKQLLCLISIKMGTETEKLCVR